MLAFDIETKGLDPKKNRITVICTECVFTGEKKSYEFEQLYFEKQKALMIPDDQDRDAELMIIDDQYNLMVQDIIDTFNKAHSLCAYNGIRFDIPFMAEALKLDNAMVASWVVKCSDILEVTRMVHGKTCKLDLLCQANNLPMKSASGLEAIKMAEDGRFHDLKSYCADDVTILCNLYKQQHLKHPKIEQQINLLEFTHEDFYDMLMICELDDYEEEIDN